MTLSRGCGIGHLSIISGSLSSSGVSVSQPLSGLRGRKNYSILSISATLSEPNLRTISGASRIAKSWEWLYFQCKTVSIHFCDNVNSEFNLTFPQASMARGKQ